MHDPYCHRANGCGVVRIVVRNELVQLRCSALECSFELSPSARPVAVRLTYMCSTLVQGQPECTTDRPAAEVLRWVTDGVMEGPRRKITAVAPRSPAQGLHEGAADRPVACVLLGVVGNAPYPVNGTPVLISDLIGDQRVSEPDNVPHDVGEIPRLGQRLCHLAASPRRVRALP